MFVNTSILCKESSYVTIINSDNFSVSYLVEVMRSDLEQQRGMMYRKSLDKNNGMLFLFKKPKSAVFWMKNTYIELSVAFINREKKVVEIFDLEPGNLDSVCSVSKDIIAAVEMKKGWFSKNKIELFSSIALP